MISVPAGNNNGALQVRSFGQRELVSGFWIGLLILAVVLFYIPVLGNNFVNWDDQAFIVNNTQIRHLDWGFLKWMFNSFAAGYSMPLTWLSLSLNYQMGGLNPKVFHATNVLLHALNTLLVFGVCRRLLELLPDSEGPGSFSRIKVFAGPIAFLTALLFGLHPIHVESVAWAVERKDVLYSVFYLGSLYLYLGYAVIQKSNLEFKIQYSKLLPCFSLYLFSILSKPMAVTLPFVFLILDHWPLMRFHRQFARSLKEKAPFFVMAIGSVLVTILSGKNTFSAEQSGLEFYCVLNAFRSLVFYVLKMFLPWDLTAYYPYPLTITPGYLVQNFSSMALVVLASYYCYRLRWKAPYLLTAWLYFIVTLAPVLGFVKNTSQAAADHYLYLPCLALFLPLAVAAARWLGYNRFLFGGLSLVLAAVLGYLTVLQIGTWRNSETLWERVAQVYPDESPEACTRMGEDYLRNQRDYEALVAFSRACSVPPPMARAYEGLGLALLYNNRVSEAISAFENALALDPKSISIRLDLWNVLEKLNQHDAAIQQIKEAINLEPKTSQLWNDLGTSLTFLKRYPDAEAAFKEARRLDTNNVEYLVNLATIKEWEGKTQAAMEMFREGIARNPQEPVYYLKLGDLYLAWGKKNQALAVLEKAWALRPQNAKTIQQIGEDFQTLGKRDLAQDCFEEAQRLTGGG